MLLKGERIRLRPTEERDLSLLVSWRNSPENWKHFFNKFPLSEAGQEAWFKGLTATNTKKLFMICHIGNDDPIGSIGLDNIDFASQNAELGNVLIAEHKALGSGYAREAMQLLLEYCFDHLNMHRVYLKVMAGNSRAVGLYEKAGFVVEGCLRQAYYSSGEFKDCLLMGLLASEYRSGQQG